MALTQKINIAIDGPAASGKSTTAKFLAKRLAYIYIDTGAMYRAITYLALQKNVDLNDSKKITALAKETSLTFRHTNEQSLLFVNGSDVSQEIRLPEVTQNIAPIAANPGVREIMVKKQQEIAKSGGVVMDGRDIGTIVLPNAELKIFMEASAEERANRRVKELAIKNVLADFEKVLSGIIKRDESDVTRAHGPLKKANDAIPIDTTGLTIEAQVTKIYNKAMTIIGKNKSKITINH